MAGISWVIFALLAAIFTALANIARKQGLKQEHALEFATTRSILAAFMALLFIPWVDFSIPGRMIAVMVFIGFLASFGLIFITKSYRHLGVSDVAPMTNLSPFFILLFATTLLGETITSLQLAGIGLVLFGAYVLQVDHHLKDLTYPFVKIWKSKYHHYVLFGLLIYAVTATLDKFVINNLIATGHGNNVQFTLLFFIWISMALTLSLITTVQFGFIREVKHAWHNGWKWIALSSFFVLASSIFHYKAISLAFVSLVIPVKRLSTLFETAIGGELFHEKGLALKIVSCIIMIVGTFFIIR